MPIEHYIIDFLSAEWLVTNFFTVSIISLILYFSKSAKSKDQKIKILKNVETFFSPKYVVFDVFWGAFEHQRY